MKSKSLFLTLTFCIGLNSLLQARYYDAASGRFLSPDSIVQNINDPQSLNRFSYVRNDPMILTDPSGHSWLSKTIDKINSWADKNPWGAFVVQQFSWLGGTALLSRTETGRNIIAGEIIVGTAVGTAMIGGPAWSGALSGEIMGGYSAYKSNGSILRGVAVGGVVGAVTGHLGSRAGYMQSKSITGTYSDGAGFVVKNPLSMKQVASKFAGHIFAQGSIRGAGMGAIDAYAGGKGSTSDIGRSALKGGLIGGVTNTLTYFSAAKYGHVYATQPLNITGNFNADFQQGIGNGTIVATLNETAAFGPINVVDQNFTFITSGAYQSGIGEFEFVFTSNVDVGLGPILGGFFY